VPAFKSFTPIESRRAGSALDAELDRGLSRPAGRAAAATGSKAKIDIASDGHRRLSGDEIE